jgi:hypothetical protein
MQLYPVKRMIRGYGDETTSTYSQTFNGYEVPVARLNRGPLSNASSKWAIFGKQNWRCGMNQTTG